MKREEIEKAAEEYAKKRFGVANNYDELLIHNHCEEAFIAGAKWRIDSAWHDMNEKPNFLKLPILLQHKKGQVHFIDATPAYWDSNQKYYTRWAYVSDLLPIKED